MSHNRDKASDLAEQFKREGHFDRLKEQILSRSLAEQNGETVVQTIRSEVSAIVRNMVLEDDNLLFKNRGSTSALIESQLLKDGYQKLTENGKGIKVDEYVSTSLSDPELLEQVKGNLMTILQSNEKE
ncbi:hypothetical protein HG535_0C04700 [Zygotorulaspora mrakii]|uniref:BOD1/SHG1 domain-containing protein n=1 Tax=Zygotorulaspora mrakii TaxID=42260 RepID=A0A7H9B122_ZYGMR|nr:uncharacterized protein HG535_0C04700 [Zygotorulaspora mrakii]QLG72116.1 hypothetical protein HG535_0C04700 [Zygotorulaspora mrakii]